MSRAQSFVFIIFVYAFAIAIGGFVFVVTMPMMHMLIAMLLADTVATIVVWLSGILVKNSSMYDPYWSVIPPLIFIGFLLGRDERVTLEQYFVLSVILVWSVRLTYNWAIGFMGIKHSDWRYDMYRRRFPKLWHIVNFFGINYMPTLLVFFGCVPLYYITAEADATGALTVIGGIICIASAVLSFIADGQLRRFRNDRKNAGRNMETGLFRFSRHPNYLGEVAFWFGVFILSAHAAPWYTAAGCVLIALLFIFISIPMMEKRLLLSKSGYADYKRRVSMLLIMPARRAREDGENTDY